MRPARSLPFVTCLVLLCLGGAAVASVSGRTDAAQTRLPFAEFPSRIGAWQGRPSLLDVETERGLGLSDYLLSDYSRADGKSVNLYVAYYASQRKGESPHSPIVCIPGGGWTITNIQQQTRWRPFVQSCRHQKAWCHATRLLLVRRTRQNACKRTLGEALPIRRRDPAK